MSKRICTAKDDLHSLLEALDSLLEENSTPFSEEHEIFVNIIPPELDELTDCEDIDENDISEVNNLPKDICGAVEISNLECEGDDIDELKISSSEPCSSKEVNYFDFSKPKWLKKEPAYTSFSCNDSNDEHFENLIGRVKTDLQEMSPRQIFEKNFSDDIVKHICEQSIIYACQKNNHNFRVALEEMRTFLGILLLTGYHTLPQERMYWSLDEDLGVSIVYESMSRDRYLEIKRYLHVADNSKIGNSNDRMYKVRPLADMLNKSFRQWGFIHEKLSADESMVQYFGRNPAKQFIKGKPVRFGYKTWMLASSCGYCYVFDFYCGKSGSNRPSSMPVGAKVIIDLLDYVPHPLRHKVYFDNYFSTYLLFAYLRKKNFKATGTVRENRIGNFPISSKNEMKKQIRGSYDYRFDITNEILCLKWNDNNVCSVLSNHDYIEPQTKVKRWSRADKAKVNISQPLVVANYNSGMGGVDIHDQSISRYRVAIKGKKWWWVLFTYMLDMAVANSWKLHSMVSRQKLSQLEFRRSIARSYLRDAMTGKHSTKRRKRPSTITLTSENHFPGKLYKQLRCAVCHAKARWSCKKCLKTLCTEKGCFENIIVLPDVPN